jgi:hypothetical protein
MPPRPRPAARLTFAAALLALAAAPAEAQFLKRVKQMAQDKVADAVNGDDRAGARSGGPNGGPNGAPAGGAPQGSGGGAEAARKAPLAITAERLDVFLAAMRPAVERAERGRAEFEARKAYDAALARYNTSVERWDACAKPIMQREGPRLAARAMQDPTFAARLQGYSPDLEPVLEAQRQAMARQDVARMEALGDSAAVLQRRNIVKTIPALADCGQTAPRPTPPKVADARTPEELIAPPAGFTRGQFGRLRERVAVYALTGGKESPFTPEERAALDARAGDLAKLAPLFRDGLLEWGQWGAESELGRRWNANAKEPGA